MVERETESEESGPSIRLAQRDSTFRDATLTMRGFQCTQFYRPPRDLSWSGAERSLPVYGSLPRQSVFLFVGTLAHLENKVGGYQRIGSPVL